MLDIAIEPALALETARAMACAQGCTYTYPEHGQIGCVEVTGYDLRTLEPAEFVNDTIMDYYSKVIQDEYSSAHSPDGSEPQLHFFNAFFYKKLTESGAHTHKEVCACPPSFIGRCWLAGCKALQTYQRVQIQERVLTTRPVPE
jgi:Ulp1 protease family, C-terminal catalytic domain